MTPWGSIEQMEDSQQPVPQPSSTVSQAESPEVSARMEHVASDPSILVVIANYGVGNDPYLHRLLAEFRSMRLRLDLHVVTDVPKDLGHDVTVHVGLPTPNPRSLPFAHRPLFAKHVDQADFFIYCEDDTLVTERNIRAFLEVNRVLNANEIPGFLRVERPSENECYVESAHGPYRWRTDSPVQRGPYTFAYFTNHHSAFTMASRAQVQRALESGGFLVPPHVGRFAMLESAASDLYTQCGLKRLICVSRIEDFLVPHLSNMNCSRWGVRYEEFVEQTRALERIHRDHGWKGTLFNVETRMPRGWWSKNLYERPDPSVLDNMPAEARTVLSIGCGCGATEEWLARQGKRVTALPVDAVFADCLRRQGIEVVEGGLNEVVGKLQTRSFDAVLMVDVIHLLADPAQWLSLLKPLVAPTGVILVSVPRTFDPLRIIWLFRGEPQAVFPKSFAKSGVQKVTRSRLAGWFHAAGLDVDIRATCNMPTRLRLQKKMLGICDQVFTDRFIALAKPRPETAAPTRALRPSDET